MVSLTPISRGANLRRGLKQRARPLAFLIALLTAQAVAFVACQDTDHSPTAPTKADFNDYDSYAAETLPDPCVMFSCHPLTEQEHAYIEGVIWSIQTNNGPECLATRDQLLMNLADGRIHSADYFASPTQTGATTHSAYEINIYLKKDQLDVGAMDNDIVHEGLHSIGQFWYNPHQQQADFAAWNCRGFQQ